MNNANAGEPSRNWFRVQAPGSAQEFEGIDAGKNLRLYIQNPGIWCILAVKMVCNADHNAFLNTLTTATAFSRVPLEMAPGQRHVCDSSFLMAVLGSNLNPPHL